MSQVDELTLPFGLAGFHWSAFVIVNIAVVLACAGAFAHVIRFHAAALARPAGTTALFAHVIFQWPLAFFSPILERQLHDAWLMAAAIHVPILGALLWLQATQSMTDRISAAIHEARATELTVPRGAQVTIIGLLVGLAVVYLSAIGPSCTALYALVFDPEMTLLARETSIKLLGSGRATYAFGTLANVLAPAAVLFSVLAGTRAFRDRGVLPTLGWLGVATIAVAAVLLPGIKGLLLPTALTVVTGIVIASRTWRRRLAIVSVFLGGTALLLVSFELIKDRKTSSEGAYSFGQCAARLKACPQAWDMMASMATRELSIGVPTKRLAALEADVGNACSPKPSARPTIPMQKPKLPEGNIASYASALAQRALVVPIQAASWHFKYAEEYGQPGIAALPFGRRLTGEVKDVSRIVNATYYPRYSRGSTVSTGTVPTSFLLAYPAYVGVAGLLLTLAALLVYDYIGSSVLVRLHGTQIAIGIGLVVVASMNFMMSDFVTTLLSHGAAAVLGVLFVLPFLDGARSALHGNRAG